MNERSSHCRVCVFYGTASETYSFPGGHPLRGERVKEFWRILSDDETLLSGAVHRCEPRSASEEELLLFHTKEYVAFVKKASELGYGYLDYGDTPAFKGVFEASSYVSGSTLTALNMIMEGSIDHAFNPIGGLHHARSDSAGGFCVFNDAALAIKYATVKHGVGKVGYVDIDAHHGDGVFYSFERDPSVYIADIHEDGKYLYPGTGFTNETGIGAARGTKLNLPLKPGSGDEEFRDAFTKVQSFMEDVKPELIILQCGADGLKGDPIAHLQYSVDSHRYAAAWLHKFSHRVCKGRLLALGGGGYEIQNTARAWLEVVRALAS